MEDIPTARNSFLPEASRHSVEAMNATCLSCGAFLSIGERKSEQACQIQPFKYAV